MKRIKLLFTVIFILMITVSKAQVGIGTTSPSGALEIKSSNSGLVPPRVTLTSTTDITTVTNPQGGALLDGTMVYNTNTAGTSPTDVSPGYYYWKNNNWVRLTENMKMGATYITSTITEPNPSITGACGSLSVAGTNNAGQVFDNTTVNKTISVSGYTGTICNITCNVVFSHTWAKDADLYLQSPNGQIIELNTDNGPSGAATFNVTFSDAGATNITSWIAGNASGTYRPEGTLTTDVIVPNITTMAGFNGFSPNGNWTLIFRDDSNLDSTTYTNFSLSIATLTNADYRLLGEATVTYDSTENIIASGMYSANSTNDEGVITALTRTTASAGVVGTTASVLPGTVLSYASDSPKQGAGNYWVSTSNQNVSNGLTPGTKYFYQLWTRANIQAPISSNEQFSLMVSSAPK